MKVKEDDLINMGNILGILFVNSNRISTQGEKVLKDITMKQWLLLALAKKFKGESTLTKIGTLMGSSRQNIKSMALKLKEIDFITLKEGIGNSRIIEITKTAEDFMDKNESLQIKYLNSLFNGFSSNELTEFYRLLEKLNNNIDTIEGEKLHESVK